MKIFAWSNSDKYDQYCKAHINYEINLLVVCSGCIRCAVDVDHRLLPHVIVVGFALSILWFDFFQNSF